MTAELSLIKFILASFLASLYTPRLTYHLFYSHIIQSVFASDSNDPPVRKHPNIIGIVDVPKHSAQQGVTDHERKAKFLVPSARSLVGEVLTINL